LEDSGMTVGSAICEGLAYNYLLVGMADNNILLARSLGVSV